MTCPPPPAVRTDSEPPEASAACRAMSRPSPVEPPPLAPRRTGSPSRSQGRRRPRTPRPRPARRRAGPRSASPQECARRRSPAARPGTRPDRGADPDRDRAGARSTAILRPWSSASTDQNVTRSLVTCAASQLPGPPVRSRALSISEVTACSSAWTWAVSRRRRFGHRFGLQPQRGERGAQPVGQVGDRLALLPDQVPDPARQVVQAAGDLAHLPRPLPGPPWPPARRPPAGATPAPARRSAGSPCRPAGPPTATPEREQHQAEPGQDQPRPGHARGSAPRR